MSCELRTKAVPYSALIGVLTLTGHASGENPGEGGLLYYDANRATTACSGYASASEAVLDFLDVLEAHGEYTGKDAVIVASELTDASLVSWGNDTGSLNVDENDITLLATHGGVRPQYNDAWDGDSDDYTVDKSVFLLGSESGNGDTENPHDGSDGPEKCLSYGREMKLGNGDVEFFHALACQSFQYEALLAGTLPILHRRLHQYGGFHGAASMAAMNDADDFAEDAYDGSVALAWIDNMTYGNSECPMTTVIGDDYLNASNRFAVEEYDYPNAFGDPDSTPYQIHYYLGGCNPVYGSILPE